MADTAYEAWFASRPASVQALILEFPFATPLLLKGKIYRVVGWSEGEHNQLILVSAAEFSRRQGDRREYGDYKSKTYCCAHHVRDGDVQVIKLQ
jgi:hypothetical protein